MSSRVNRQWRIASRPTGAITPSNFAWKEEPIPIPKEEEFLVRNIYLSLDPAAWGWMQERISYVRPLALGDIMRGLALGVVEQSNNEKYRPGDLVYGLLGWQDYTVTKGTGLIKHHRDSAFPFPAYLSIFGLTGITAYFGLLDIGKPKEGETLLVSAAEGSVGSTAGQIGKIKGCYVVGIAGTEEKCGWLTDDIGFDAAVNYKTESLYKSLSKNCPKGVDVYFDNVGGAVLQTALYLINLRARIVLCGQISQYNIEGATQGPNLSSLIEKRARIEGFLAGDYFPRASEAITDLQKWVKEGRMQYKVDVIAGLENAPKAIGKLFDGTNMGKLMVKISEEPD